MNRVLLSYVGLCLMISGCAAHQALSTHDAGQPASAKSGMPQELRKFDIQAEDATIALNEWSKQADQQLLFDFSLVRGRQTHPVAGMLQPSEALKSMLKDTGLVASVLNERTWTIAPDR